MNNFKKLCDIFRKSNEEFINNELDLILSGVSERSLCGKLSCYLNNEIKESEFNNYHVDIEYNRNYGGSIKTIIGGDLEVIKITCDIIVHSRGNNIKQDNLIAIEMKKSTGPYEEKIKDKNRLIALTKRSYNDTWSYDGETLPEHVCGYILGIYYEIDIENRNLILELYKEGTLFKVINYNFTEIIPK